MRLRKEKIGYNQSKTGIIIQTAMKTLQRKKQDIRNDIHADVDNSIWFDALYDYLLKRFKNVIKYAKSS